MIYSNFPNSIFSETYKEHISKITLGERGINRREIFITCPYSLQIYQGMNPNLNFEFSKGGTLKIREYHEDWHDPSDPRWNIPQELFLLLTTNFTPQNLNICKYGNGIISTLAKDVMNSFRMFACGHGASGGKYGNKGFWNCGIYKVTSSKPLIVRIQPAGYKKMGSEDGKIPYTYLLIKDTVVEEYSQKNICNGLDKFNLPSIAQLANEEWGTL